MMSSSQERRVGDTVAIPGEYQHRATHHSRFGAQRFWHQKRFEACLEMLSVRPGMRVLDVGCGSGVFSNRVAGAQGVHVVAVDANTEAVRFVQENYARDNLEVHCGYVDALAFEPASFDRIACLEVIEHVHLTQAQAMLSTFARLLKPSGKLLVSTPNAHSGWPVIEWAIDRLKLAPEMEGEQHVITYSAKKLEEVGRSAGLALQESRTVFVAAPFLAGISWPFAERLHGVEQRLDLGVGALLLQTFSPS